MLQAVIVITRVWNQNPTYAIGEIDHNLPSQVKHT